MNFTFVRYSGDIAVCDMNAAVKAESLADLRNIITEKHGPYIHISFTPVKENSYAANQGASFTVLKDSVLVGYADGSLEVKSSMKFSLSNEPADCFHQISTYREFAKIVDANFPSFDCSTIQFEFLQGSPLDEWKRFTMSDKGTGLLIGFSSDIIGEDGILSGEEIAEKIKQEQEESGMKVAEAGFPLDTLDEEAAAEKIQIDVLTSRIDSFLISGSGGSAYARQCLQELSTRAKQAMIRLHPRIQKLIDKRKYFIVISEDELYFREAYCKIRLQEMTHGDWTEEDEEVFQLYCPVLHAEPYPSPAEAIDPKTTKQGDWVRFMRDGKFIIGVVDYVRELTCYPHNLKAFTDRGSVDLKNILEVRRD